MNNKLAIIIPAYKAIFLKETLDSIANQTCKDFTLYIGDDASPEDLQGIIKAYQHKIKIIYRRFENNLGAMDLVAHWNRCIDMTNDEDWLWLFSDDDIMDPNCIELFYNCIQNQPEEEVLHFDVKVIDNNKLQIEKSKPFPPKLSTSDFFKYSVQSKINSYVVEYIFKKALYLETGKFEKFDLAWCADNATWIKFSKDKGIRTIKGAKICWRYSGYNISSNMKSPAIIERKINATINYLKWANNFFTNNRLIDATTQFDKIKLPLTLISNSSFSFSKKNKWLSRILKQLGYKNINILSFIYLLYIGFKSKMNRNKFKFGMPVQPTEG